ncbi:MAG: ATP-dependent helicase UvrD/PcrA, partial [Miltoncostaeaceae bacterium]|nr:ATP-dependent helicase UvrD/PcrA [Miltoncostaeaceae bacterium]
MEGVLNPAQRAAVLHGDGPLLILAGAGSGKTRVLTHRIAHLIGERGVSPDAILAITFTNKAAGEMRERIHRLVGPRARAIWASTFHSACVRILRRDSEAVGYARDFTIYDADDQLRLIRKGFADEQLDPKRIAPRAVQARIADAKSRLLDPEELAEEAGSFLDEQIARLYRRYADALRANGAMDFDDLLMLAVRLLEGDAAVRERYQQRFQHVLVDEYQDTNHAQYRLVRVLGEPQRNVVVVGDDDQGIYSWRGADVRNIRDFGRDYPDAEIVALEQNYRSTNTILRAANAVVSNNPDRHAKNLWTDRGEGEPIQLVACRDEHEEARVVVSEVERSLGMGDSLSELAVFYRTNAQSRAVEDQLVRRGIAYQVIGGPKFYERAEVRDLLAYRRAAANPNDSVSLGRMLGAPKRGIGPGTMAKLSGFA